MSEPNKMAEAETSLSSLVRRFFPSVSYEQLRQFELLPGLYREWNAKINVVSRKDIDHIEEHHILHSLGIARFAKFAPGAEVLDIGTGGGFPGIPLSILFPEARFTLIDGTGKKVMVAKAISEAAGLQNVTLLHARAEELPSELCHYIVSRGALPLSDLYRFGQKLIFQETPAPGLLPKGIIVLKGGLLTSELRPFKKVATVEELEDHFPGMPFFREKKVIYLPL